MKRWLLYAVCLALLLSAPTAVLHAQAAQTPLWPSARTSGWNLGLNGMPVAEKLQVYAWSASHYDFLQSVDGRHLDYLRSLNPTVAGLGRYSFFISVIEETPQQQAVESRATSLGIDVEDVYMHYSLDKLSPTRANYDIATVYPWLRTEWDAAAGNFKVYVPGWDASNDRNGDGYVDDAEFQSLVNATATARRKLYARISEWSWGPPPHGPQWRLNLGVYEAVNVVIELLASALDEPLAWGQSSEYSLLWFDSVDGWLWTGDKVEYPHEPGGDGLADWQADLAALISYAKVLYSSRVLIGANSGVGRWVIDKEMDVCVREAMFNTWSTARDWEGTLAGGLYGPLNPSSSYWQSRQAPTPKIQLLQHQYNLLYYITDRPEVWARDRLFGVAAYYLLQNPGYDYWAAYRGFGYWPTLTINEKMWSHALEVDIGAPTDSVPGGATALTPWGVWVFAEGADPGHPDYPDITKCRYKVYAREYTNGLVLLKPKSGNDAARSTFADNTATTHALGGWYQPVNDDGTLGEPTTSAALRNGEAAIFVGGRPTVTLTVTPGAAIPGSDVTYVATCTNPFPDLITSIKIQGYIPAGTTYVTDSALLDGTPVTPQFAPDPDNPEQILIWIIVDQIAGNGGSRQFEYKARLAGL